MFDLLRGVRAGPGRVEWKALLRRDASRGAEAGRGGLRSRYAAEARPRHDCGEGKTDADAVIATLRIALDTGILDAAAALANVAVLTGREAEETTVERDEWRNDAFTEALLEALAHGDHAGDGLVGINDLICEVEARLSALTEGRRHLGFENRIGGGIFVATGV